MSALRPRLVAILGLLSLVAPASAGPPPEISTLFATSNDLGDGNFGTIDQATGDFTDLGDTPTGVQMPALACDDQNQLFGSENTDPEDPLESADGGTRCGSL